MPESSNNKPDSTDTIVTTSEDTQIILTVKDFGNYTDPNNNPFTSVKITTLETAGALKYLESPGNWVDVHKDDIITVADIKDGKLRFEPGANDFGDPYTHFNFKVIDSTNDISSHDYQLTVKVTPVNDAPTVIAPSSFTVTEDVAGNLTFTGIPFADVDNTSLTVTLSITDGTISASTSNKVTVGNL
ncbi:MAG: hypothetical protein NT163_09315 [Chlorobiales bacterium]|nr:hypothetical protein [Chlorobiales bacterium]